MHRFLLSVFFMAAQLAAFSQNAKPKASGDALLNNLKKHIGYLASDALEGRRTGTPGEKKTVEYLVAQYKSYGVQPMAGDNSFVQVFDINEGREIKPGTWLKVNNTSLVVTEDYFPFAFSPNAAFNGTMSFIDVKKKQPMFFDINPLTDSSKANPHFDLLQKIRETAKDAAEYGSTALFLYNTSAISDSLQFSARDKADVTAIPVIYVTAAGVKKLKNGATLSGNTELGDKTRKGHNVISYIDNGAATTVILGGHLDHLGYGEDHNSRNTGAAAIHNGADDNASGTCAVVELARILKEKSASAPAYKANNYLFINFSGEELGLYGSKYFTEHPTIDLSKVSYMINMDMIGRLNDSSHVLTVGGVGTSNSWGDVLDMNAQKNFTIKVDSSGTGPSDHTSFYRKDIPVLFFFTGLHTDYHKPSDDAGLINYKGEADIINYITDIIGRAGDKGKLAFTKTKEQSMGTGRFKVSVGIMPDYTFSGTGVRADGVIDGRAAQKAGVKTGDIIIQLGEHLVTGMDTYMGALNRFNKGESTKLIVKRGVEILEFGVTF
ncbi:MAG: M28 family peptidase [Bacteroidota bacterium]